jgi:hypothetical protein
MAGQESHGGPQTMTGCWLAVIDLSLRLGASELGTQTESNVRANYTPPGLQGHSGGTRLPRERIQLRVGRGSA